MSETTRSIEELLSKYNIQLHDLEYILTFMQKENITPQLAMRRIKLFEKLQEKMAKAQEDEKVRELTSELDHLSKIVEDLQAEKEKLQKEIEESKRQQDLFEAEREELKLQMKALMESIPAMEADTETEEELQKENQELKKNLNLVTAGIRTLKDELNNLSEKRPEVKNFIFEINGLLGQILKYSTPPKGIADQLSTALGTIETKVTEPVEEQVVEEKIEKPMEETISPEQIKFIRKTEEVKSDVEAKSTPPPVPASTKSINIPEPEPAEKAKTTSQPSSKPIIKEKLFVEPEEIEKIEEPEEKPLETKKEFVKKEEPIRKPMEKEEKPKEAKKVDISAKPLKEEKAVSPKIEKILKLFISYVNQADSDENFKARISAICDMDEAYIELGGLAMAQIYSYQTQGLNKKKEFERLLQSWIENGLPR